MKQVRTMLLVFACCAFLGLCLSGCSHDVKQEPGQGGKGMSAEEKKAKRGE
jgi:hypothetical protein